MTLHAVCKPGVTRAKSGLARGRRCGDEESQRSHLGKLHVAVKFVKRCEAESRARCW